MKHEMPVMTEEKRQALIDHAKESILRQKDLMSRHDELLTNDLFQNGMILVEIALASLMAEVHSYTFEEDPQPLYTVPPVPVMPWDDDLQRVFCFAKFVIKCVRKNREYSPLSSQEPDEIDAILRKIEEDK